MKPTNPHAFPETTSFKRSLSTEIAEIYFYERIVVVEAHEGATLSFQSGFSILLNGLQITGFKPFVYISNRINSYSVDPNDYKYLNKIKHLKGIALVCYSETAVQNAELEKKFCTKPLEIFRTLEAAHHWTQQQLTN